MNIKDGKRADDDHATWNTNVSLIIIQQAGEYKNDAAGFLLVNFHKIPDTIAIIFFFPISYVQTQVKIKCGSAMSTRSGLQNLHKNARSKTDREPKKPHNIKITFHRWECLVLTPNRNPLSN